MSVNQDIPVEKLIKGRFQETKVKTCQYFRMLFDANVGEDRDYDARAVRNGAQMGLGPKSHVKSWPPTGSSDGMASSYRRANPTARTHSVAVTSTRTPCAAKRQHYGPRHIYEDTPEMCYGQSAANPHPRDMTSEKQLQKLQDKLQTLEEKKFYFEKCRLVEIHCLNSDHRKEHPYSKKILEIIYSTEPLDMDDNAI